MGRAPVKLLSATSRIASEGSVPGVFHLKVNLSSHKSSIYKTMKTADLQNVLVEGEPYVAGREPDRALL